MIACLTLIMSHCGQMLPPMYPLSLTNYWPLDESGQHVAWYGQADGNPYRTALNVPTRPEYEWDMGACVFDWVTFGHTQQVSFWYNGQERQVACTDNFGSTAYRVPFWHDYYQTWVIPVDVFTPEPLHVLIYDWHRSSVPVSDYD